MGPMKGGSHLDLHPEAGLDALGKGQGKGKKQGKQQNKRIRPVTAQPGGRGQPSSQVQPEGSYYSSKSHVTLNLAICQTADQGDVWDLLQLVNSCLDDMNCVNLSTAMHRIAKLTKQHNQQAALLKDIRVQRIEARVAKELEEQEAILNASGPDGLAAFRGVGPRCWSSFAWSHTTLQCRDKSLLQCISRLATSCIDQHKPCELAQLLWAVAKAGCVHSPLFEVAGQYISNQAIQFTQVDLSTVAWAYATANFRPCAAVLKKVAEAFLSRIAESRSQEIANLCWALATAHVVKAHIFQPLGCAAAEKLRTFKIQEFSSIAWAFAKAGVRHEGLFNAIAQRFQEDPQLSFRIHPQGVANLLWALAKQAALYPLSPESNSCTETAVHLLPACRNVLTRLKPQEFSSALWAFAKMNIRHGASPEADALFAEAACIHIEADLQAFSAQALTNIVHAYVVFTQGTQGGIAAYGSFVASLARTAERSLHEFEPLGLLYLLESALTALLDEGSDRQNQFGCIELQRVCNATAIEAARRVSEKPQAGIFPKASLRRLAEVAMRLQGEPRVLLMQAVARMALAAGSFRSKEGHAFAEMCGARGDISESDLQELLFHVTGSTAMQTGLDQQQQTRNKKNDDIETDFISDMEWNMTDLGPRAHDAEFLNEISRDISSFSNVFTPDCERHEYSQASDGRQPRRFPPRRSHSPQHNQDADILYSMHQPPMDRHKPRAFVDSTGDRMPIPNPDRRMQQDLWTNDVEGLGGHHGDPHFAQDRHNPNRSASPSFQGRSDGLYQSFAEGAPQQFSHHPRYGPHSHAPQTFAEEPHNTPYPSRNFTRSAAPSGLKPYWVPDNVADHILSGKAPRSSQDSAMSGAMLYNPQESSSMHPGASVGRQGRWVLVPFEEEHRSDSYVPKRAQEFWTPTNAHAGGEHTRQRGKQTQQHQTAQQKFSGTRAKQQPQQHQPDLKPHQWQPPHQQPQDFMHSAASSNPFWQHTGQHHQEQQDQPHPWRQPQQMPPSGSLHSKDRLQPQQQPQNHQQEQLQRQQKFPNNSMTRQNAQNVSSAQSQHREQQPQQSPQPPISYAPQVAPQQPKQHMPPQPYGQSMPGPEELTPRSKMMRRQAELEKQLAQQADVLSKQAEEIARLKAMAEGNMAQASVRQSCAQYQVPNPELLRQHDQTEGHAMGSNASGAQYERPKSLNQQHVQEYLNTVMSSGDGQPKHSSTVCSTSEYEDSVCGDFDDQDDSGVFQLDSMPLNTIDGLPSMARSSTNNMPEMKDNNGGDVADMPGWQNMEILPEHEPRRIEMHHSVDHRQKVTPFDEPAMVGQVQWKPAGGFRNTQNNKASVKQGSPTPNQRESQQQPHATAFSSGAGVPGGFTFGEGGFAAMAAASEVVSGSSNSKLFDSTGIQPTQSAQQVDLPTSLSSAPGIKKTNADDSDAESSRSSRNSRPSWADLSEAEGVDSDYDGFSSDATVTEESPKDADDEDEMDDIDQQRTLLSKLAGESAKTNLLHDHQSNNIGDLCDIEGGASRHKGLRRRGKNNRKGAQSLSNTRAGLRSTSGNVGDEPYPSNFRWGQSGDLQGHPPTGDLHLPGGRNTGDGK